MYEGMAKQYNEKVVEKMKSLIKNMPNLQNILNDPKLANLNRIEND
jgi:hypothetical protein